MCIPCYVVNRIGEFENWGSAHTLTCSWYSNIYMRKYLKKIITLYTKYYNCTCFENYSEQEMEILLFFFFKGENILIRTQTSDWNCTVIFYGKFLLMWYNVEQPFLTSIKGKNRQYITSKKINSTLFLVLFITYCLQYMEVTENSLLWSVFLESDSNCILNICYECFSIVTVVW